MLLEEFHNPLGVSACSFQSGDAVEEVGLCNAAERVSPGFVCLPYAFERTSMGGAEIRPVGFAGLTADGTGHGGCMFLWRLCCYIFALSTLTSPKWESLSWTFSGGPPGEGGLRTAISLIQA